METSKLANRLSEQLLCISKTLKTEISRQCLSVNRQVRNDICLSLAKSN